MVISRMRARAAPALPCLLYICACAGAGPQRVEGTVAPPPSATDSAPRTWSVDATVPTPAALTAMLREAEAASRRDAPAKSCSRLIVHRHLVGITSVKTFMLGSPDATTEVSLCLADGLRTARPWQNRTRLAAVEEKLASQMEEGKNDGPAHARVTFVSSLPNGGGRFSFEVTSNFTTYATCHGLYEDLQWRGTFDADDAGQLLSVAMTGKSKVTEDVCDFSDAARTDGRLVVGRWNARYSGELSKSCPEDDNCGAR